MSSAGGQYRLCWCSGATGLCSATEHFRTDAGTFMVVGPRFLDQHRTCVAGRVCTLDGISGEGIIYGDNIMVLNTCSLSRETIPLFPRHASLLVLGRDAVSIKWGNIPVTAAGGQYQLCWCSGLSGQFSCSTADVHRVVLGTMSIVGPSPLDQQRTCVSGRTCHVDSLLGYGLSAMDSVMVLETCGLPGTVPRFPFVGLQTVHDGSGASVRWGTTPGTASGGLYRMCWCTDLTAPENATDATAAAIANRTGTYSCSMPQHFRVDAGSIVLVGPRPLYQDRTCVSGQTCLLDGITGQDLTSQDGFFVLETCGLSTLVPRFPTSRYPSASMNTVISSSGRTISWGDAKATAAGGQYRLCWCTGDRAQHGEGVDGTSDFACQVPSDYLVDAGRLTMVGPAPLIQHRTCVSGQTCVLDSIIGQHLTSADRLVILDTCGVSLQYLPQAAAPSLMLASGATFSWGYVINTAPGGQYRLCWCVVSMNGCGTSDMFAVDFGRLDVIGTKPMDRTCISGQQCRFDDVEGHGLQVGDMFLLLETCGTIGFLEKTPQTGYVEKTTGVFGKERNAAIVNFGLPELTSPGGLYRLCWCPASATHTYQAPNGSDVSNSVDCTTGLNFRVDSGQLLVLGPSPFKQQRTCVSGQTCELDAVLGKFLALGDKVMLLDTCNTLTTAARFTNDAVFVLNQQNRFSPVVDISAPDAFAAAVPSSAAGGVYRLCWCAAGQICDAPRDFKTDFGHLSLHGPRPLEQAATCVSGHTCKWYGHVGHELTNDGRFMILDTCATASAPERFVKVTYNSIDYV